MDHEMSDYYDRECRAAHALGVCPECHFEGGLHNEGQCSQWRDQEPSDEPEPSTQGYHLIDGILHRCPIWDGAEACAHCERLDTPPDLSYQATFERAIRVEDY